MFDLIAFLVGLAKGKTYGNITLEGDTYEFTDSNNDGNIVITEVSDNG